ncbi:MAG: ABC transporter ATP-binding protein [Bacteroidales bacterium]|jgi:putative ABC transport system ATP-binding protein|nr:ABC transporter ATP-binding protein [Bacteroidales bacterium]
MILKTTNLCKKYEHKDGVVDALNNVSFEVNEGDFVTITGASGSGKTTLLLSLAGLIKTTSGEIKIQDFDVTTASDRKLSDFRKNHIGFVMQSFALIPYLTAIENIMLPLAISKLKKVQKFQKALDLLKLVGLENRKNHLPQELSAGQQQRVAIARALVNSPSLILADEPTGNLDPNLSTDILQLLKKINNDEKITILMVTHSPLAAEFGNLKIKLTDGKLSDLIKERKIPSEILN